MKKDLKCIYTCTYLYFFADALTLKVKDGGRYFEVDVSAGGHGKDTTG